MKIVFLSRYQNKIQRGAENFVTELSQRLARNNKIQILSDTDADNIWRVIEGKYGVVIPINGRLQSLKASLGRLFGGYKLLISGHSGIGRDDIWNILVKPDVFVALTDYQFKWAKKWSWGSEIVKIPDGIDLNKFNPAGEKLNLNLPRPIILSVGALAWYKYHERAIKAVSQLKSGSLLIAGIGEEKDDLTNLGNKLLGDRFEIVKFKYEDMPKVYRSCDLFTLPSWDREAFGIVYLEAMASGLGVVAPDDSLRREIVGHAGVLIDVADISAYSQAIDKALPINWSKIARKQAQKFSWDRVAKQYEDMMKNIMKKLRLSKVDEI